MVIAGCFFGNQIIFFVTKGAIAYSGVMFAFFKMTDKAATLGDSDVFSLNNLGVAAGTTKTFSSLEVSQVNGVIEDNLPKFNFTLEKSFFVATLTKASRIRDFCPGL